MVWQTKNRVHVRITHCCSLVLDSSSQVHDLVYGFDTLQLVLDIRETLQILTTLVN